MHLLSVTQKQQNRTIIFLSYQTASKRHPIMFAVTNDSHALSEVGAVQLIDVICVAPLRQQKSYTFNIWAHMCDKVHKQFKVKRSFEERGWRLLDCMHTYIYIYIDAMWWFQWGGCLTNEFLPVSGNIRSVRCPDVHTCSSVFIHGGNVPAGRAGTALGFLNTHTCTDAHPHKVG